MGKRRNRRPSPEFRSLAEFRSARPSMKHSFFWGGIKAPQSALALLKRVHSVSVYLILVSGRDAKQACREAFHVEFLLIGGHLVANWYIFIYLISEQPRWPILLPEDVLIIMRILRPGRAETSIRVPAHLPLPGLPSPPRAVSVAISQLIPSPIFENVPAPSPKVQFFSTSIRWVSRKKDDPCEGPAWLPSHPRCHRPPSEP